MWRFVLRENILRYRELLSQNVPATDRAVLHSLLEEAEAELATLNTLSTPEVVRGNVELRQISEKAVGDVIAMLGAQSADLRLVRATSGRLFIVAQKNLQSDFLHHFEHIRVNDGSPYARCCAEGTQIAIEDVMVDPMYVQHLEAARIAGFRAVLSSPIRLEAGKSIGVLTAHFAAPHRFAPAELSDAANLAQSVAADIEMLGGF